MTDTGRAYAWVVTLGSDEDFEVLAVFDDRGDAFAVRDKLGRRYEVTAYPRYPAGDRSFRRGGYWIAQVVVNIDGVVGEPRAHETLGEVDDHGPLTGGVWEPVERDSRRGTYLATGTGFTQEAATEAARGIAAGVAARLRAGADPRDIVDGPATPADVEIAHRAALRDDEHREAEAAAKRAVAEEARWWRETRAALYLGEQRISPWHPVSDGYIQVPPEYRGAPAELSLRAPDGSVLDLGQQVAGVLNTPLKAVVWETGRSLRH